MVQRTTVRDFGMDLNEEGDVVDLLIQRDVRSGETGKAEEETLLSGLAKEGRRGWTVLRWGYVTSLLKYSVPTPKIPYWPDGNFRNFCFIRRDHLGE